MKVKAIWEFDADVSDILPEHVDIEGHAKDLAIEELRWNIHYEDITADDFQFEVVTGDEKTVDDVKRETALEVLKEFSNTMYPSNDIFGKPILVMSRKEFEAIRHKYLDKKEEATDANKE